VAVRISEATEALERLGLTRYEATVFLNLARSGAATAGEVARACGVNRVQTYRALESLGARGLVEVTLDRPRRYAARAIDEAFDMILGEKRSEIEWIEATRKRIVEAWSRLSGRQGEPPSVRLQVIKGRAQIYRALLRLLKGARREVLAFTTTKGIQRSYRAGINEALLAAMARGVRPRLIADINASNRALMARVAEHVPLRHVDGQRARFILVDRESIIAFLIQDERRIRGEAETALWTNSPDFVRAHLEFFDTAWAAAIPAAHRLRELRARGNLTAPTVASAARGATGPSRGTPAGRGPGRGRSGTPSSNGS